MPGCLQRACALHWHTDVPSNIRCAKSPLTLNVVFPRKERTFSKQSNESKLRISPSDGIGKYTKYIATTRMPESRRKKTIAGEPDGAGFKLNWRN